MDDVPCGYEERVSRGRGDRARRYRVRRRCAPDARAANWRPCPAACHRWIHHLRWVDDRLMEVFMNVLTVSKRDRGRKLAPGAKGIPYSISIARSPRELTSSFRTTRPDVVVIDRRMPRITGQAFLERLLAEDPSVPILIVDDIDHVQPDTLARLAGLSRRAAPSTKMPARKDVVGHALSALHHPASARVDARRVAEFFGLSLAEFGRLLGRSPQAVHKTPDAPALQDRLSVFARIATALTTLFGSPQKARVWLNAPNPDLDKARPIELLRKRKADVVADLLEDALMGHPS